MFHPLVRSGTKQLGANVVPARTDDDEQQLADDLLGALLSGATQHRIRQLGEAWVERCNETGRCNGDCLDGGSAFVTDEDIDRSLESPDMVPNALEGVASPARLTELEAGAQPTDDEREFAIFLRADSIFEAAVEGNGWWVVRLVGSTGASAHVALLVNGGPREGLEWAFVGGGVSEADARAVLREHGYLDPDDLRTRFSDTRNVGGGPRVPAETTEPEQTAASDGVMGLFYHLNYLNRLANDAMRQGDPARAAALRQEIEERRRRFALGGGPTGPSTTPGKEPGAGS